MNKIADILNERITPEGFREALVKLNGDFDFSIDSMISLGEVYCKLYPDSVDHSDSAQVQAGYKIVRFVIIEHIIKDLDDELKKAFREILLSANAISQIIPGLVKSRGKEKLLSIANLLDKRIKELKETVDTISNGVIKERWTGGISVFYNTIYIIKKTIEKLEG